MKKSPALLLLLTAFASAAFARPLSEKSRQQTAAEKTTIEKPKTLSEKTAADKAKAASLKTADSSNEATEAQEAAETESTEADNAEAKAEDATESEAQLSLDALEAKSLLAFIGGDPKKAFEAFGAPVSLNVLRGAEPPLDDVVTVHEAGVYLFWFQDRVWQIGFGSYFSGTFEGISVGAKESDLIEKLGKPLLRDEKMVVYEVFHREFPVSMRFVTEQGKVSEIYLYRSDL